MVSNQPLAWKLLKWSWKMSTSRQPWAASFLLSRILWLLELPAVRLASMIILRPKDTLSIFHVFDIFPAFSMFILDRYIAPIVFFLIYLCSFRYHQKQDPWLSWTKTKFMKSLHLVTLGNWMTRSWPRLKKLWCGWVSARHRLGKPWPKSSKGQQLLSWRRTWKAKPLNCFLCKARWKVTRSLELRISRKSKPNLPALANVFWFLYT